MIAHAWLRARYWALYYVNELRWLDVLEAHNKEFPDWVGGEDRGGKGW